jgi:hypothetical protein
VADAEGTVTGIPGAVLVPANNTGLLPPGGCPDFPVGMHACQDVCYRTISLQYIEPKDFNARQFPKGPWTSLEVTTVSSSVSSSVSSPYCMFSSQCNCASSRCNCATDSMVTLLLTRSGGCLWSVIDEKTSQSHRSLGVFATTKRALIC